MRTTVLGAGGLIGGYLTRRLVDDGHQVRAVDIKPLNEWYQLVAGAQSWDADCRDIDEMRSAVDGAEQVFNLAADMGGIGFIEGQRTMCSLSALVTGTVLRACIEEQVPRLFYSSSACALSIDHQHDPDVTALTEDHVWPIHPEPGYGEEKWFGEQMHRYAAQEFPIETRIARYHNIYGHGTWEGGREKAPAAVCRKVATAVVTGNPAIEVWGDGQQTRSYCWIDDCVEGTLRLMASDHPEPLNIGSEELISVDDLYHLVAKIAGLTDYELVHDLSAPQGVRGRNADLTLCRSVLGWESATPLADGMAKLYEWVYAQVAATL